ncbi:acyl-CoA dehydrogenase family protein [Reyranella sp.]|uniref:acyl-CoA dehydrogenase family protein n=1 Tax=Reyranella sp. TaxID=1929291 RepID=UPI0027285503|nr:acyl-CoA dehydrogenase family protein [Reyranella sp.]MDO8973244.1 acyl-CoA dehydrogenase family protein [Reyranella sp.]
MASGFLEDASFNQSPAFGDVDLFSADRPLAEAAARAGLDLAALSACGRGYGAADTLDLGRLANENPPRLRTMDGKGNRLDLVEFHPAYHALMKKSIGHGIHASAHDGSDRPAPMSARAVRLYLATQAESGHMCPITMTHACIGALRSEPALLAKWLPKIQTRTYDPRPLPWWEKNGVTLGMGMTERQGGTDVRANITSATQHGDHAEISGHKWFMSAPMCDAFLVLAQAETGLTCYLMPRYRPDGSQNAIRFQRLKDKLGNKSNASSEVEFHGAWAERVGAEGAGVRTIIEMVNLTRLDCAIASAGQSRIALSQAIHHIRNRSVFQRRLADQPAMRAVASDMALELEAQVALVFRLIRAAEHAADDPREAAYARLLTPAVKFLVCKSTPQLVYESLECLGGNGYTEDLPMARYFRESPLNAIWEGSGNVMALDVLRAAGRHPEAATDTLSRLVRTADQAFKAGPLAQALEQTLKSGAAERRARFVCESLAKIAAVAALVEAGSPFAALYAETRLGGSPFAQFGSADLGGSETVLMDRALAA